MKKFTRSLLVMLVALLGLPLTSVAETITFDFAAAAEKAEADVVLTATEREAGSNNMGTALVFANELQELLQDKIGFFFRGECTVTLSKEEGGLVMTGTKDTYMSVLNLKAGDKVTVTYPTGSILFCDKAGQNNPEGLTNVEGITAQWAELNSDQPYTMRVDGNFNFQWKKSKTIITKIVIESDAAEAGGATFDFNNWTVATSSGSGEDYVADGDITEALVKTESGVTLTVSPGAEDAKAPNRFWSTNAGPQLRCYSGSITIESESAIKSITFDAPSKFDVTPDGGTLDGTIWNGDANKVVFTVNSNTQINKITVSATAAEIPSTPEVATIAAFKALEKGTEAILTLKNAFVTAVSGNYIYVQDASGAICFYNTGLPLEAGKVLNGTVTGKFDIYNSLPEFVKAGDKTNADNITITDGTLTATTITVAEALTAENISKLVNITGATIAEEDGKFYAVDGDAKIQIYDQFKVLAEEFQYPDKANIVGIVGMYKGTPQIYPLDANSISKAAERVLADGKYYIANMAAALSFAPAYLGAGNSWGTQASLVKHPEYAILSMLPDGTYTMETQVSNGGENYYLGENGYMDANPAMPLTLTKVRSEFKKENGEPLDLYTITSGEKIFGWDGETTVLANNLTADSEKALWIIASEEEALEGLASATAQDPQDATFLFLDPNFGRNNRNKGAWEGDDFAVGGDNTNMNAEKWGGNSQTFDIHQTAEVPNGVYQISWNGFYRYNNTDENTNEVAIAAHADGTEVINSFIYINGEDYPLTSIADDTAAATLEKLPFSQGEASAAFAQGLYAQSATVTVTDGKLTIGIKKTEHPGTDWTVWDNFELEYLGAVAEEEEVVPDGWVSVINNGKLEGEENVNFYTKENSGDPVLGTITAGAGKNGTRGIVINTPDNPGTDWDAQFFIKANETIPAGAKIHVEFDYKATQEAGFDTQSHFEPGNYIHWYCVDSYTAKDEWQHMSKEVEVSAATQDTNGNWNGEWGKACDASEGGKPFQTIAFNLSKVKTATTFYFDNIIFWVSFPEEELATAPEGWHSVISNGNLAADENVNFYTKENSGDPVLGTITAGAGKNGTRGIVINTPDNPGTDWDAQFFIKADETIPAGAKIHVEFDYKATQEAGFDTQSHFEPGNYIHWYCVDSYTAKDEWQHMSKEVEVSAATQDTNGNWNGEWGKACDASEGGKPFQTIAFNLSKVKTATTFYFDNIIFWVTDVDTSVKEIKYINTDEKDIYNLRGQKMNGALQKGIYIKNGKKVVIK